MMIMKIKKFTQFIKRNVYKEMRKRGEKGNEHENEFNETYVTSHEYIAKKKILKRVSTCLSVAANVNKYF